ncbi:MAG: protein phosphatase 2C domain-containing protein [Lachnospiraceae bacterium]|nr:protein phosphatase 2C domain-containing protein [Lachnospiraceae bacterium]
MQEVITDSKVLIALGIAGGIIVIVLITCILIRLLRDNRGYSIGHSLHVDVGNAQTIGTREKQDDSFAVSIREYGLMALVADGIGGYINGKLASSITAETFMDEFEKRDVTDNLTYYFQKSAMLSNERIRDEFGDTKGGTTLVAVVLKDDKLFWTSVGDSNIAVFRGGRLIMVNRKENVKNFMEDQYHAGAIAREEALSNNTDTRLVNYLGYDGFKKADESDRPIFLKKGDKVLIYSDGVEVLGQIGLEKLLSKKTHPQKTADTIIAQINAYKKKNKDNATIVILTIK